MQKVRMVHIHLAGVRLVDVEAAGHSCGGHYFLAERPQVLSLCRHIGGEWELRDARPCSRLGFSHVIQRERADAEHHDPGKKKQTKIQMRAAREIQKGHIVSARIRAARSKKPSA